MVKDWNDLRFFLSVARLGSLSAAARALRVDPATVGRRIKNLEEALSLRCFERRADGYRLTETGRRLLEHAERVEGDLLGLSRAVDAEDRAVSGQVAITASEAISLPFLIPMLPALLEKYPHLSVDLLSSNRVLSLARREADIALRMVRPAEGDLLTRKIADIGYGLFASADYLDRNGEPECMGDLAAHRLIDWLEDYPRVATTSWFRALTEASPPVIRLNGSQERLAATLAGVGVACLSFAMARGTGLSRVLPLAPVPAVELWMLTHPDSARVKRIRAVMDFIVKCAAASGDRLSTPG